MYNFTHWKQALLILQKTQGTDLQTINIEDKKDTYFFREAARRYSLEVGPENFFFSFSDDLSIFQYQFKTEDRARMAAYHKGLSDQIKAIKEGEEIEILDIEANIATVRVVAYTAGYSVVKTENGCIVKHKVHKASTKEQIATALMDLQKPGDSYDVPCTQATIKNLRVNISQVKDKEASYSVKLIGDNARITKIK